MAFGTRPMADQLHQAIAAHLERPEIWASRLRGGGEGSVSFIVIREEGRAEFEIELPGTFRLTPELAGGIKALDGVVDVRLS